MQQTDDYLATDVSHQARNQALFKLVRNFLSVIQWVLLIGCNRNQGPPSGLRQRNQIETFKTAFPPAVHNRWPHVAPVTHLERWIDTAQSASTLGDLRTKS